MVNYLSRARSRERDDGRAQRVRVGGRTRPGGSSTHARAAYLCTTRHTTIGARSDIEKCIERMRVLSQILSPTTRFASRRRKFDEAKTLAAVNRKFRGIPRPLGRSSASTRVHDLYARAKQDGERTVTLRESAIRSGSRCSITRCRVASDYPAIQVLSSGSPANRLASLQRPGRAKAREHFGLTLETREPASS